MGKYSRDLNEALEEKVKSIAAATGFREMGITVEAVRAKKCKTYGEIVKPNDLTKLFLGDDDTIVIALYEDLFDLVDEETQNYWIEALLAQVWYDNEKEKMVVTKPELAVSLAMYHKYKNVAVQKEELAVLTIQQIEQKKKEEKEAKRAAKEAKKNK